MEIVSDNKIYFINDFENINYLYIYENDFRKKEYKLSIEFKNDSTIYLTFDSEENRDYYYNLLKNKLLNVLNYEIKN